MHSDSDRQRGRQTTCCGNKSCAASRRLSCCADCSKRRNQTTRIAAPQTGRTLWGGNLPPLRRASGPPQRFSFPLGKGGHFCSSASRQCWAGLTGEGRRCLRLGTHPARAGPAVSEDGAAGPCSMALICSLQGGCIAGILVACCRIQCAHCVLLLREAVKP